MRSAAPFTVKDADRGAGGDPGTDDGRGEDNTYGLPEGVDIRRLLTTWFKRHSAEVKAFVAAHAAAALGVESAVGVPLPRRMPDLTKHNHAMGDAFTPLIGSYWQESGEKVMARLGLDPKAWQVVNPHLRDKIQTAAFDFCASTNASTTKRLDHALDALRREFVEGQVDRGDTLPELTKRVNGVFEGLTKVHAGQIAATEASRAVHAAQVEAGRQSNVVVGIRLLLSADACPLCQAIAAQCPQVPLGGAFAVIGTNPTYSTIQHPPLHVGCQCSCEDVLMPQYGGPENPEWGETYRPGDEPKPKPEPVKPTPAPAPAPKPAAPKPEPVTVPPKPVTAPGPKGDAVSSALKIAPGGAAPVMRETAEAVDRVHGGANLRPVPVKYTTAAGELGTYEHARSGPVAIKINTEGEQLGMTLAHEMGHWLEMSAIPGHGEGDRPMERDPLLAKWRDAVLASEARRSLVAARVGTAQEHPGLAKIYRNYLDYLLSMKETWARSYAQYVATRGGSPALRAELDAIRKAETSGTVRYPMQWADADFEPIAAAMDELFKTIGWRS